MGVDKPEILLTADPALTLRQAPEDQTDSVLLRAGIPPHGRYICFALRRWKGFEEKAPLFSKAAEYAYRTYGLTPVFAAVEKHLDPGANQMAARGLSVPHYFLNDAGSAGTIIGALSRMEIVVSMRLHALIFAAGQGIPLAGVVYDPQGVRLPALYRPGAVCGSGSFDGGGAAADDRSLCGPVRPPGGTGRGRQTSAGNGTAQRDHRPASAGHVSNRTASGIPRKGASAMKDLKPTCRVAVIQAAPLLFRKDACVEKAVSLIPGKPPGSRRN